MLTYLRRFVVCALLIAGLAIAMPTVARADDNNQDYNAYWQEQTETQQQEQQELQNLQQNYNAYWQEVAEQQAQQQG